MNIKTMRQIDEKQLSMLKDICDEQAGYNISTKSQDDMSVRYRSIFYKVALGFVQKTSLEKIGSYVNKSHATVALAKKIGFDEIKDCPILRTVERIFKKESESLVLKGVAFSNYRLDYEFLRSQYLKLHKETRNERNIREPEAIPEDDDFIYKIRSLNKTNFSKFKERALLILKSFEWKEYNEEFEVIQCHS